MHTPEGRVQLFINQKNFLDECVEKQCLKNELHYFHCYVADIGFKKNYIYCTQNIHNANSRRFCTSANQTQLLARVP